jgi:glutamate 5-kinase
MVSEGGAGAGAGTEADAKAGTDPETSVDTDTDTDTDTDATADGEDATVSEASIAATRRLAAEADRVIVKAGTNSLTDDDSRLSDAKVDKLVDDIEDLLARGKEVILVSSGAIGAGAGRVDVPSEAIDTVEASQALSTVGQSHLMRRYTESFERYDRKVAQILLTQQDLENPERFTNFHNTIETLLDWGIVPIINENDAVATAEIRIGDNDMLSASVALGVDVDLLVTLTDVAGVYTANPKRDADARLVEAVGRNYDAIQEVVESSSSGGFGGIRTKVEGARDVAEHGIPAVIAGSAEPDVLARIAEGKPVGTIFVPVNGPTDD